MNNKGGNDPKFPSSITPQAHEIAFGEINSDQIGEESAAFLIQPHEVEDVLAKPVETSAITTETPIANQYSNQLPGESNPGLGVSENLSVPQTSVPEIKPTNNSPVPNPELKKDHKVNISLNGNEAVMTHVEPPHQKESPKVAKPVTKPIDQVESQDHQTIIVPNSVEKPIPEVKPQPIGKKDIDNRFSKIDTNAPTKDQIIGPTHISVISDDEVKKEQKPLAAQVPKIEVPIIKPTAEPVIQAPVVKSPAAPVVEVPLIKPSTELVVQTNQVETAAKSPEQIKPEALITPQKSSKAELIEGTKQSEIAQAGNTDQLLNSIREKIKTVPEKIKDGKQADPQIVGSTNLSVDSSHDKIESLTIGKVLLDLRIGGATNVTPVMAELGKEVFGLM